jgi:hypothetical protein
VYLQVVMHNPGHLFRTDPNGFVVPFKPTEAELEAAAVEKKDKAAEAAALDANHGSLFDHLLKSVLNEKPPAAPAAAQEPQQKGSSESIVEQMNWLHQEQEQRKQQQEAQEAAAWGSRSVSTNGNGKQRQQQQQAVCDMTPKTEEGKQAKAAFLQQYGKEYGYGGLLDQLYPCEVRCVDTCNMLFCA